MNIEMTYILALASVVAVVISFYAVMTIRRRDLDLRNIHDDRIARTKSTYFLDSAKSKRQCEICFGNVDDESILECSCGRIFHVSCARLTKECPYCKSPYSDMRDETAAIAKCPSCGKLVIDNVCACGTVLPNKDNSFKCVCGSQMTTSETECSACGAEYRSEVGVPRKTV